MAAFDPDQPQPADSGIFGLPFTADDAKLVLLPVPWDATTSYRPGTAKGPAAILKASHQLDVYDVDLGEPWRAGIAMLPPLPEAVELGRAARQDAELVIAAGGRVAGDAALEGALRRVNQACEKVMEGVYRETLRWRKAGKIVGVVGGDHSVPYGAIRALAEEGELGILHIDAHADLREAYEGFTWSHASIMHNVLSRLPGVKKLVQVGIRDLCKAEADRISSEGKRVETRFDSGLAAIRFKSTGLSFDTLAGQIVNALPKRVWISFDIDGLDPAYCPHTGTPVPGGLDFHQACYLIRTVREAGVFGHREIVGFDLNEVAPGPDPADEWDANVGARILYKLCGYALRR